MSGRTSFIIIGIVTVAVILFVYRYSTPNAPTHFMPVGVDGSIKSTPVIDTAKTK